MFKQTKQFSSQDKIIQGWMEYVNKNIFILEWNFVPGWNSSHSEFPEESIIRDISKENEKKMKNKN